ncbi:hypothetical protein ABL78_4271 [Leptomonas seymouri]|uniref:Microsomal signal peptidase 12 kDa subunit n=1 Tax=Leptomonas seymouri TaxID=5684 RepID=A0A0N0P5M9_LEPSE|nr:hypothetical protein ABL78_4271 [Leptomonas seymouri]|eukprot:KPI86656.1 hypothetical protein ABL78_4271 [Leptomonas seymouri]
MFAFLCKRDAVFASPPAPYAAPTASRVHPAAQWLAQISSPMSLRDQAYCSERIQQILWYSLFVSFPVAFWLGNAVMVMGAVGVATVVCLLLFFPNWYQNPDPLLTYADGTCVYYYYQQYNMARKQKNEHCASAKSE